MKKTHVLLLFSHSISNAASFMMPMMPSSSKSALSMVSREEYLKPHFKSRAIEPKIKKINMEELTAYVESDECDLEEISRMLRDLEHLDSECTEIEKASMSDCEQLQMTREAYTKELSRKPQRQQQQQKKKGLATADHLQRLHEIADYEEH